MFTKIISLICWDLVRGSRILEIAVARKFWSDRKIVTSGIVTVLSTLGVVLALVFAGVFAITSGGVKALATLIIGGGIPLLLRFLAAPCAFEEITAKIRKDCGGVVKSTSAYIPSPFEYVFGFDESESRVSCCWNESGLQWINVDDPSEIPHKCPSLSDAPRECFRTLMDTAYQQLFGNEPTIIGVPISRGT